MEYIDYNISKNYLSHWNTQDALREVMQNFIDYGKYEVNCGDVITVSNTYEPIDLSFMSVGMSLKNNEKAIGKYGEGLKMALMILTREGYESYVKTNGYKITPCFRDTIVGETFSVSVEECNTNGFEFFANLDNEFFKDYYENKIIKEEDILFNFPPYGSIVSKNKGDVFCGGLFVSNVEGLSKAYDFNTNMLKLDRDRQTPKVFDVNWNASAINSAQGKIEAKDLSYSDNQYVSKIPDETIKEFTPKAIGDEVRFVYKNNEGKEVLLKNEHAEQVVKSSGFFKDAIKKLKLIIASKLGLYELLMDFKKKHVHSNDAVSDFDLILGKLGIQEKKVEETSDLPF